MLKRIIARIQLPRYGRFRFYKQISKDGRLLDVGCGNDSPYFTKLILPNIYYVGIDIGKYQMNKPNLADEYILAKPSLFANEIKKIGENKFNTIISSHNLEHCSDRWAVLEAMTNALKPGGFLYLAFPCEKSTTFPSRGGTLNYYDDSTHQGLPPNFNQAIKCLRAANMKILIAKPNYKPFVQYLIGMIRESKSKQLNKVDQSTWAYWGFESVIWAQKNKN